MHIHRTIALEKAAGSCAIELEDQLLPEHAHYPHRDRAPDALGIDGGQDRGGGGAARP